MKLTKISIVSGPPPYTGTWIDNIGLEGELYKGGAVIATLPYTWKACQPAQETIFFAFGAIDADEAVIRTWNVERPAILYLDGKTVELHKQSADLAAPDYVLEYKVDLRPSIFPKLVIAGVVGTMLYAISRRRK